MNKIELLVYHLGSPRLEMTESALPAAAVFCDASQARAVDFTRGGTRGTAVGRLGCGWPLFATAATISAAVSREADPAEQDNETHALFATRFISLRSHANTAEDVQEQEG
jgi:hypothetical protein